MLPKWQASHAFVAEFSGPDRTAQSPGFAKLERSFRHEFPDSSGNGRDASDLGSFLKP